MDKALCGPGRDLAVGDGVPGGGRVGMVGDGGTVTGTQERFLGIAGTSFWLGQKLCVWCAHVCARVHMHVCP